MVIYRPSPTQANNLTVSQYKEESPLLLESLSITNHQLLIAGDLNVRIDDPNDGLAPFLLDTLSAFGIKQQVECVTYNNSQTVDLVMTRLEENIKD